MLISFQSIERLVEITRESYHSLEVNTVHIWGIELDGSSHCLERCGQWLDEGEQQRAARFVREEDRSRYRLAHGGLRAVLSRYLGTDPGTILLHRNAEGKPFLKQELEGRPSITFNMSHAYGRALIAVSAGQEIGVDLERIRSDVEVAKLSERYFARSEHSTIMQAAPDQRPGRFFRYWVSKEAVLKAQGVGLQALSQCVVLLGFDGVGAEILVPEGSRLKDDWTVRLLSCGEGWEGAVAAQGRDWVVRCGAVL